MHELSDSFHLENGRSQVKFGRQKLAEPGKRIFSFEPEARGLLSTVAKGA
jgi:hypothetical protein